MRISPSVPLDFSTRATRRSSDFALDIGLGLRWSLRSGLSCCRGFLGGLCCSCLFSSLALSLGEFLGFLCESLGPFRVNLLLSLKSDLGLLGGILYEASLLCGDLSVPLRLPSVPFGVGLLLCESALGDSAIEVLPKENSLVREDSAGYECRLSADIEPFESLLAIKDDGGRVGVRVVRAELLDETSVARRASVCHNNVEECEILLTVALKSDFNSHCESVLNC